MPFAEDQHSVGDLGPGGEDEPFGVSVRARTARRDLRCRDAGAGQGRVEGVGELPGAVADQEPEVLGVIAKVHQEAPARVAPSPGPAPLKALSRSSPGRWPQPHTPGVRFAGLRTVAFDGLNSLKVPDTDRNRSWLGKIRHRLGMAGYPALRVMVLAETGTRGLLGATVGSVSDRDEVRLARRLLPLLGPGMLILLDRAFDAAAFLAEITATGAMLLARAKSTRQPLVLACL